MTYMNRICHCQAWPRFNKLYNILFFILIFTIFMTCNSVRLSFAFCSEKQISTSIQQSHGDDNSITREFTLKNLGSLQILNFSYTDHIPSSFCLRCEKVEINGTQVEYIDENGNENDVYNGMIPYRWVISFPAFLLKNDSTEKMSSLKIIYSISSLTSIDTSMPIQNSWIGLLEYGNPIFGYNEISLKDSPENGCFFSVLPLNIKH